MEDQEAYIDVPQDVSVGRQKGLKEGTGRQDSIGTAARPSMHLRGKLLLSMHTPLSSLR